MNDDDFSDTVTPKSDQLNADDLLAGPITITIESARKVKSQDQPVIIEIGEGRQPYKPCLSMRRVLINVWGGSLSAMKNRNLTLFNDTRVHYKASKSGGIRISHMSNIDAPVSTLLTVSRNRREEWIVEPIFPAQDDYESRVLPCLKDAATCGVEALKKAFEKLPACHEKNELWKRHGDNLKAEAEKAA